MTPHLITTVGGDDVSTLDPMLRHYAALGIQSFFINLHLRHPAGPIRDIVHATVARLGLRVTDTYTGSWNDIQQEAYAKPRRDYPNDWFLLADSDEFHECSLPLPEITTECVAFRIIWHRIVNIIWHTGLVWTNWPESQKRHASWPWSASGCSSRTSNRMSL
ncbi:MAG: hypothetical protein JNK48_29855 [Bryobacterales bacterium]|nr:hypothetical protein [Bryobacterales bacterium]